jgi:hypothetical protein
LGFITRGPFNVSTAAGVALGQYADEGDAIEAALADALANGDRGPYTFSTEALDVKFLKGFAKPVPPPAPPPVITVSQLIPDLLSLVGGATESVDFSVYASGATFGAAYSISASSTSLAALGLSFSGTTLSSSDLLPGTGIFQLVLSKSGVFFHSNLFTLRVLPALAITTDATVRLPAATTGTAYAATISAANGTAPYTWSITADTPDTGSWLTINSSAGVLSGTPGTAETESVTVQVTDSLGATASKTFSLVVGAAGGQTLLSYFTTSTGVASGQTDDLFGGPPLAGINSSPAFNGSNITSIAISGHIPAIGNCFSVLGCNAGAPWQFINQGSSNTGNAFWLPIAQARDAAGIINYIVSLWPNPAGINNNPWTLTGNGIAAVLDSTSAVYQQLKTWTTTFVGQLKTLRNAIFLAPPGELNLGGGSFAANKNWMTQGISGGPTSAQVQQLYINWRNWLIAGGYNKFIFAFQINSYSTPYNFGYPASITDAVVLDNQPVSSIDPNFAAFANSTGKLQGYGSFIVDAGSPAPNIYDMGAQVHNYCVIPFPNFKFAINWGGGPALSRQNNPVGFMTTSPMYDYAALPAGGFRVAGGLAGG